MSTQQDQMVTDTALTELERSTPNPQNHLADSQLEYSSLDLLIAVAERKRIILFTTVSFGAIAVLICLLLPNRYTATATLLPPQQGSSMSSLLAGQLGSLGNLGGMASMAAGGLGMKNPNDLFVAMLKSRTVEDAMVQQFGLMQEYHVRYLTDARNALERHTTIDGSGKDTLIHLSVEASTPARAAQLANGYVDQFRHFSEHLAVTEASQRRLFFEQQLEQAKDNLAQAEEALKATEQKTGLIQLDSQARALIESAVSLRAQIAAKEVQIQSLRTYATGENAQLIQAQQELDELKAQLAKLGGANASMDAAGLIVPKGQVPQAGLEYIRKFRDVKYYETIFEILARQFEMAKLDEAKEGAPIQVVDFAVPPEKHSSPQRTIIVIAATISGFFIGLFVALVQVGLQRIEQDPEMRQRFRLFRRALSFKPEQLRAKSATL
ncbi:MAG: chain length determinant family protein [Acidobacteriaceae bacterium]|nr:chain length determinant family protein [Acidobacteriaceae bacterium]